MSRGRRTTSIGAEQVWRELQHSVEAPDLTRPVMGRLGYMRLVPEQARRRRIRRVASRIVLCLAAVTSLAVGLHLHNQSPQARRPDPVSLPEAIDLDLSRHQRGMSNLIQMIRRAVPPTDSAASTPAGEADQQPDPRDALEDRIDLDRVRDLHFRVV